MRMKFVNFWIGFKIMAAYMIIIASVDLTYDYFSNENFNFNFSFWMTFLSFLFSLLSRYLILLFVIILIEARNSIFGYLLLYVTFGISFLAAFISIDQFEYLFGDFKFYNPFDSDFILIYLIENGFAFVITFLYLKFRIITEKNNIPTAVSIKRQKKRK